MLSRSRLLTLSQGNARQSRLRLVGHPMTPSDSEPLDQEWLEGKIAANKPEIRRWFVKQLAARAVEIMKESDRGDEQEA